LVNHKIESLSKKINQSQVEEYFLKKWEKKYKEIEEIAPEIESVNINQYLSGVKQFMKFHLASEGLK